MPNAETHLTAACDLLADPEIMRRLPWLAADASRAAFLMGAISPDVRAIGGQTREQTHFFAIPPEDDRPAPAVLCADWPQIAQAARLDAARAAFIAGYMTHLVMDQTWVERIVMPGLYIAGTTWGPAHPNWRLYCILMTYLEYRAGERLPPDVTRSMVSARPEGWLPFVTDADLFAWCSRVAKLIDGGGPKVMSFMLSQSCGLTPEEMETIVRSEDEMARRAYPTVPGEQLLAFEAETAHRSRDQVMSYLAGTSVLFS